MASIKKTGEREYYVRISRGTGKRRIFINKRIRGTLKDAQRFAREKETALDTGAYAAELEKSNLTLDEFLDKWLVSIEKKIQPATHRFYTLTLQRYVRPFLGSLRLPEIKPFHVQDRINAMLAAGLSSTVVRHAHGTLRAALNYAVKMDYLAANPCQKADVPKKSRKEIKVLSQEEAFRFVEACQKIKNGLIFELALETGARPEEYLALRWRDVDFARNAISINQAVVFLPNKYYFADTKTKRSRRRIPISQTLRDKLLEHRRAQNDWRTAEGIDLNPLDLVFVNQLGSPFSLKYLRRDYFPKILELANINHITIYSLRHSCASLLLQAGANPKVVAERLGHSSVSFCLDVYSHLLPGIQEGATERLDNVLRLKSG